MREILFRGKRKDKGEWVEGFYDGKSYIYTGKRECIVLPIYVEKGIKYEVIPETVCQYTGLTDRNGRKIFEGDILKYDNEIFVIKYIEGFAAYSLRHPTNTRYAPAITPITTSRIEVIGNIFDNPELIGE